MRTNSIARNMPFKDYAAREACHKSALSHVKTAKHLRAYEAKLKDENESGSDALRFGKIFHEVLFEGADINAFEIYGDQDWIPKKDHPNKISIDDQKRAWKAERELYFLNEQEKENAEGMVEAVKENPLSAKYINAEGDNEISLFWQDQRTGLECKTRIDKVLKSGIIVELKTDADPSPEKFGRKAYNLGYQIGAWFNREGYRVCFGKDPEAFIFIVVEKSAPYSVGVYMMNAHDFDSGEIYGVPKMKRYQLIKRGGLRDHNQGEDGEFEVMPLQTPRWELKIIDDEMSEIEAEEIEEGSEL